MNDRSMLTSSSMGDLIVPSQVRSHFFFFFFSFFANLAREKDWGDTPLPGEETETLAKLAGASLADGPAAAVTLHPADASSTLQVVKGDRVLAASSWAEVGLRPELLSALAAMRFNRPSKIQAVALPVILGRGGAAKQSFIGQAQSGSGKTAAFVLGFLEQMTTDAYPQAIVVAPTLELAEQIYKDVLKMSKDLVGVKAALLVKDFKGKAKITEQVIVGTPGKLTDLVTKFKQLDLSKIK